jgi:hypothetical protein
MAMSDKRAVLQRIFQEVVNEGRLEVADELFAEDFVSHGPMGDMEGREAFKSVVAQWRSAVPDLHCEVRNVIVGSGIDRYRPEVLQVALWSA